MTISLESAGARPVQILANLAKDIEDGAGDSPTTRSATDEDEIGCLSKSSRYTSLRDLIAVSPEKRRSRGGSPRSKDMEWCDVSEVKFKDNLLKLAAIAYLQPTGKQTSPESHFFAQAWESFNANNVSRLRRIKEFFHRTVETCGLFLITQAMRIMKDLDRNQRMFRTMLRERRWQEGEQKRMLPELARW